MQGGFRKSWCGYAGNQCVPTTAADGYHPFDMSCGPIREFGVLKGENHLAE